MSRKEAISPGDSRPATPDREGVDDIVADVGAALREDSLPLTIFNHRGVHERELEDLFGTAWIFVGHESEVAEPGDYALRYVGEDPFIFVRDESGEINVIFDCCQHRGTTVVRAEQGNTSHFRCPYHGWTYKNDGELVGIPYRNNGYEDLDLEEHGLAHAPRVDSYKGLVFASLARSGPSLEEFIGDFAWYLDLNLDLTPGGMEVVGEPFRWRVDMNWKLGAENFAADNYHVQSAHESATGAGGYTPPEFMEVFGDDEYQYHIADCSGHCISLLTLGPDHETYLGYPEEVRKHIVRDNFTDGQWELVRTGYVFFGTIFPNLSLISNVMDVRESDDEPLEDNLLPFFSLRKWQPRGPDEMEFWSWTLAPKEASDELKRDILKMQRDTFAPGGIFEGDDITVWESISKSAGTTFAKKERQPRNFEMGNEKEPLSDWPGPGTAYETYLEDSAQLTIYKSWYNALRGAPIDEELTPA